MSTWNFTASPTPQNETDSKVTLHWIKSYASRWKTYVANRVSSIQQKLPEAHWKHVSGRENPADCASRGISPKKLLNHPLWWTGPNWLRQEHAQWPINTSDDSLESIPEKRIHLSVNTYRNDSEPEILLRFSNLHRLLRVFAWCHRWRKTTVHAHYVTLHPDEIDAALLRWLKVVQGFHFASELTAARDSRPMPHRSRLDKLASFIDDLGILWVGGRLKHTMLSYDERHPIVVPPMSWLMKLLVESCHRRILHGGVQLTLGLLRLRYWIPQGRAVVKRVLHRCVTCTRWRALSSQPLMGDLPRGRVTPARPFLRTGVDYAGPIFIHTSKGRGHRAHKAFVVVFICLFSRAVHLDVASDYSSEAFLAAFRRFISRRSLCKEMYSDCGTNFIGANKELRRMFHASFADGRRISQSCSQEGVSWRFNPPAALHFGGLWEVAVKSIKYHLRRVIGETTLTFEEMRAPLLALPESSLADEAPSKLSRWQLLQQMRDHFWQLWSQEYIHSMTSRPKWFKDNRPSEVGALCLIRSDITPPTQWSLARILKTHPGEDGVTRVVTVRTAASELVRPLTKIVLLPVTDTLPRLNA
ncbi:uncharacterized protein LOC105254868 [Camponotus floridanus]|uniref:uncharacterized protein LOC105254868 n=1 Tax=Camponotus floridanus TaxID=104421 RepID=UPI000DC6A198|nr:uncharacterized protein LOC105254868 [Camponotus floridanus]